MGVSHILDLLNHMAKLWKVRGELPTWHKVTLKCGLYITNIKMKNAITYEKCQSDHNLCLS